MPPFILLLKLAFVTIVGDSKALSSFIANTVSPSDGVCTRVIVPEIVTHEFIILNLGGPLSAIFFVRLVSHEVWFVARSGIVLGAGGIFVENVEAAGLGKVIANVNVKRIRIMTRPDTHLISAIRS